MRLGAHVSISGGKYKALERGMKIGCEAIQVFVKSPRMWNSKPLEQAEIDNFIEKRKKMKDQIFPIIAHNSYLINLASIDEEKLSKSHEAMLDELTKLDQLDIEYENMHPGVIPISDKEEISKKEALNQIADQLNALLDEFKNSNFIILLETTAGHGEGLGHKFWHLNHVIENVKNKKRIGVCFDTAHSFAAGYDFRKKNSYDALWNEFDDEIGLNYLHAFHLNDTDKELGSRVDRHAHVGQGRIGKDAFKLLVNDDKFKDHPGILETPEGEKMFKKNLDFLKSLRI